MVGAVIGQSAECQDGTAPGDSIAAQDDPFQGACRVPRRYGPYECVDILIDQVLFVILHKQRTWEIIVIHGDFIISVVMNY